jgi:hypothetical protein
MAPNFDLIAWDDQMHALVRFGYVAVNGTGQVAPRLAFTFEARVLIPNIELELDEVVVDVSLENELLGRGGLREPGYPLFSHEAHVALEVPISRTALNFASSRMGSAALTLALTFRGIVRSKASGHSNPSAWEHRRLFSREPSHLSIPRSTWYDSVVKPLGGDSYVFLEVPIPPLPAGAMWRKAQTHLAEAEKHLHSGNDAEVLQRCYAVLASLGADPRKVLAKMGDSAKRTYFDAALKAFRNLTQSGRHVAKEGGSEGDYEVDHRDAEFVLAQTKIWLTYIARLSGS